MMEESIRLRDLTHVALELWAEQERRTVLPVEGYSMWPVLRRGERILVRHGGNPPRAGDIVVIRADRRTVAHRAILRRRTGDQILLRTKGDANPFADRGWVGPERIVGVVEGVLRDGVPVARIGISGWVAGLLARLSWLQGLALLPLRGLMTFREISRQ